jgi:hypothetical protein
MERRVQYAASCPTRQDVCAEFDTAASQSESAESDAAWRRVLCRGHPSRRRDRYAPTQSSMRCHAEFYAGTQLKSLSSMWFQPLHIPDSTDSLIQSIQILAYRPKGRMFVDVSRSRARPGVQAPCPLWRQSQRRRIEVSVGSSSRRTTRRVIRVSAAPCADKRSWQGWRVRRLSKYSNSRARPGPF